MIDIPVNPGTATTGPIASCDVSQCFLRSDMRERST